ncbi:hypothetical protein PHMEG_00021544 [Phytophthora megakarya]|uniref:DUF7587 domain-containing protein n=1 Tax=Phytophthora megakarya TaxID=4795 RepID=A0A225VLC4_9STRA|nr:hypothetical protein PHMEG_00021544 [Phytophthora megakarya]
MAEGIVNQYQCSTNEKPHRLCRVQYDGSMSLQARGNQNFSSEDEFKWAIEAHLNWFNHTPTPFVSTFSNRQQAKNWAHRCSGNGHKVEAILELNPLRFGPIFSVLRLVQDRHLGVNTNLSESTYVNEYLVLDEIPRNSIIQHDNNSGDDISVSDGSDISDNEHNNADPRAVE